MAKAVRLPQFGQTMEEGTIVDCLVKVGDKVKKGDVIFEIETDKATLEMECPAEGFVKHIFAEIEQTVLVGEPLMVLGEKDEKVGREFIDSLKKAAAKPSKKQREPQSITTIITGKDLKETAEATAEKEIKLGQTIPLNRLQKITAKKMLQSKREIPCFYLTVKTDVTDLMKLRERLNSTSEVKISYHDFIMRAVAMGLEKFPIMTGRLADDAIELAKAIGIGLAISVPDGLVAPIVKNVNKKDVAQIARDTKALIEKAQNNKLELTDLEGGCITVSNLGTFGVESFIPIVVPGQCSILGIGQISDGYLPADEEMAVRKFMNMTLSADHKVTNGAYAAQFLDYVRKLLEDTSTFE